MNNINQEKILLKKILKYLIPYKVKLLVISICLTMSTVIGFFQPLIIRNITDKGMIQKNLQILIWSVLILLILVIINQILEVLLTKIFTDIHNDFNFSLSHQAFNKLLHLKLEYFNDKNNSETINIMQTDVDIVSSITDRMMIVNISYLFKVISGLVGLLIISWKLTIIVLAMVPLKYLIVQVIAKKKKKKMEELIESYRDYSAWFGDNFDGVKEIKLWNLYTQRHQVFEKKQKNILRINKENTMLDTFNYFCEVILEWSVSGILYILGGIFIINGTLTVGGVFSFLSYSNYVTGPISSILNIKYCFSRIMPSAKRLFAFFDLLEEPNNKNIIKINENIQEIQFRDVTFGYGENRVILKNISFKVSRGEKVAIIGSNGSGKTTIVNLLLRFIEPTSGEIILSKENINRINMEKYRSFFSVVSQDPYLFYDTIFNNINLDLCENEEKVKKACNQSGANEFINKLPEREKSKIGKNGARLSGGEKQKLAVARAIVKDSQYVILDEATSGYDVESDSYLHDVLLNELADKSVILITHRYSNLEGMDRIYKLRDGKLEQIK